MPPDVYVVVPAYNEEPVIASTIADLRAAFDHIVVVDDGSSDATKAVAEGLGVTVLRHLINLGQGAALQTGIRHALERGATIIASFDADGQHQVSDVVAMVDRLRTERCDVVLGSRFLGSTVGMSRSRRLLLRGAVAMSNLTSRTRLTDTHNGLRVMNRRAAASLEITQFGMAHASEIVQQLSQAGMRIEEHPVTVHYTDYSVAKGQRSLNAVNILLDLLLGRFSK
jgi:glycosyltransferase involved in cell wall biosynthesis